MGLLSGLESLGLGQMKDVEVFEQEKESTEEEKTAVKAVKEEKEWLFDKTYTCPVCDGEFTTKTVRAGKAKLVSSELDLRPKYEGIDPVKYEAVVCEKCGYAALSRFFTTITTAQERLVREQVSANFQGIKIEGDSFSYDDAITRYKLALLSTVVKKGKASEKAYTCLKLAWVYRGKAETLPEDLENREAVAADLKKQELECIKNAYEGFNAAFSQENFPMCGMDENTVMYLVAELARRSEDYEAASRWVSQILVSKTANERLKEKARDVKQLIIKEKEKQ